MKLVLIIAVLLFSTSAVAQDPPKGGNEQPMLVKPTGPVGCTPLGTVEGRKLWAGDCVANRPKSAAFARAREAHGPIGGHRSKRIGAREPIDAGPRVEE